MSSPAERKSPRTAGNSARAEYLDSSAIIAAFTRAMQAAGIEIDGDPIPDGQLHRVHIEGQRRGTKNGAYILFHDRRPAGWFQDFVSGVIGTWSASGQPFRPDPDFRRLIEQARQQRQAEADARHSKKQAEATRLWASATPCESHPYLTRKRVVSHGLRVGVWRKWLLSDAGQWWQIQIPDTLLVPMVGADGQLHGLQGIFPERHPDLGRDKDFLVGKKAGLFYVIGEPTPSLIVAEGYATAASLHAMTGKRTFIAFDAGGLMAVAKHLRQTHPDAEIILGADNDAHTPGNPGVSKARAAALAVRGKLLIPPEPGDWNDWMLARRNPS